MTTKLINISEKSIKSYSFKKCISFTNTSIVNNTVETLFTST